MVNIHRQSTAAPLALGALRAFSFMQQKLDRPGITHVLLLRRALDDLKNANSAIAEVFLPQIAALTQGALWADTDWKNCNHYYHPTQKRGMWLFSNAVKECMFYFDEARRSWQDSRREESAFYLGAAIHLIQDLCVPFHTIPQLLMGHRHFEEYAEKTAVAHFCDPILGPTGQDTVGRLATENSLFSADFLPGLLKEGSSDYDMVLGHVVPQALYSTKQAFELFMSSM